VSAIVELTRQLVAIESINPELGVGGSGEGELARFVTEWCERAGLETTLSDAAPGRPNVVAVARGTGGGRSLMLNAHMDTVGVVGMTDPFVPKLEDGRLYGRGAHDMKGSLAACMLTAADASRRGLRGDVIVTAVADEEVASVGTEAIAASLFADAAIVTEPTDMQVAIAHRGFVHLEIETIGRAAHGSRPHLGIDAIAKMGRVLVGIEELDLRLRASPTHPYVGSGSAHASLVEGGQEYSSYPARCVVQAERRTIPGENAELAVGEIQAILDAAAKSDPDFQGVVRSLASRDPFEVDGDADIVTAVGRCAASVTGSDPDVVGVPFWADSALLSAAGIPTVVFGPRGDGLHTEVEWVDVASLEQCVEIYGAVAAEICG
jgi:acetylornithine deacetylase